MTMGTSRRLQLILLLLLLPSLHASEQPKIPVECVGTSIWINSLNYRYQNAGVFRTIHNVDFGNLRLVWFGAYIKGRRPHGYFQPEPYELHYYQLKGGQWSERYSSGGGEFWNLRDVEYFGSLHGATQRALLTVTDLGCGGSCSENGEVMVFELRKGNLFETQQITYNHQAPGAGVDFSPRTGVLVISGRHEDNSAHCCPDKLDVATFKWDGKAFRVRSVKVQPVKQEN